MKSKFMIIFLIPVILLAGCGKPKTVNTITVEPVSKREIVDINEFQNIYKDWANRLISVAGNTNQAYNDWSSGRISKDEFISQTEELYKETKRFTTQLLI